MLPMEVEMGFLDENKQLGSGNEKGRFFFIEVL
jgi:hypothetical protein